MKYFILTVICAGAGVLLVMDIIATVSVLRTRQLSRLQKVGQVAFVWCVPFVGAMLVTHLLAESDPDTVIRRWIPNDTINAYVLQLLTVEARVSLDATRAAAEGAFLDAFSPHSDHSAGDHSADGHGHGE
jgi:hypothetical protein